MSYAFANCRFLPLLFLKAVTALSLVMYVNIAHADLRAGKILECYGKLTEYPDFIKVKSTDQHIAIFQTPHNKRSRWKAILTGALKGTVPTNGPIYANGTTVNSNGDGVIYLEGVSGLKVKKNDSGELVGQIELVRTTADSTLYQLIWEFNHCELSGRKIDQRESRIWGAQDQLNEYQLSNILRGGGQIFSGTAVRVSKFLQATGVEILFNDNDQKVRTLDALSAQGIVRHDGEKLQVKFENPEGGINFVNAYTRTIGEISPFAE